MRRVPLPPSHRAAPCWLLAALCLATPACDADSEEDWPASEEVAEAQDREPGPDSLAAALDHAHDDECGFSGRSGAFELHWSATAGLAPELQIRRGTEWHDHRPVEAQFVVEDPSTARLKSYTVTILDFDGESTRLPIPEGLAADVADANSRVIHATLRACADASDCEFAISDEAYTESGRWMDEDTHRAHIRAVLGDARPDLFSEATVLSVVDMKGQ